ncbi:MAG TPA: hypothetical protein VKB35_19495 [Ktedonobacteraceae bacterium]|nr:hypothetical protein [Ktedonobacteraceae bacterium]
MESQPWQPVLRVARDPVADRFSTPGLVEAGGRHLAHRQSAGHFQHGGSTLPQVRLEVLIARRFELCLLRRASRHFASVNHVTPS